MAERAKALEILEYLRTKLEIPEHVISLDLHIAVDSSVTIDCNYIPTIVGEHE